MSLHVDVDDKNEAKFPKFIAGSALFLACAAVMALPFDVTNVDIGKVH